jgi:hypothetical protein
MKEMKGKSKRRKIKPCEYKHDQICAKDDEENATDKKIENKNREVKVGVVQ